MQNFSRKRDINFRVEFPRHAGFHKNNNHPEKEQEMIFKEVLQEKNKFNRKTCQVFQDLAGFKILSQYFTNRLRYKLNYILW
jgi:hypothetical protein